MTAVVPPAVVLNVVIPPTLVFLLVLSDAVVPNVKVVDLLVLK